MRYSSVIIFLILNIISSSCKKDREHYDGDELSIHYEVINKTVSYQQPVTLYIEPNKPGLRFTTVLVMNNNTAHLMFKANSPSQSGNKIILSDQSLQPYGVSWSAPLPKNVVIDNNTTIPNKWSSILESGLLIAVAYEQNNTVLKGLWNKKSRQYLGLSLKMNDGIHYGWVCISHEVNKQELQIHDWAYNAIAGQPVKAGQH